MTITPEQFNKLVTKEDLNDLKEEIFKELGEKIDQILIVVDGIAKKHSDFDDELTSNQAAHDRFGADIIRIKERVDLKA